MKKILLLMGLIILVFIGFTQSASASGSNYLPGGKNYISKENLEFHSGNTLESINPILLKPETDYVFSFSVILTSPFLEVFYTFYENNNILDELSITESSMTTISIGDEHLLYFTFRTDELTNYISFQFSEPNMTISDPLPDIQLEEGTVPSAYEEYIPGSMIDTTSPYFQSSGKIISYVDQPITLLEIQNSLVAHDTIDGDVSASITMINDGYSEFMNAIGTYTISFSVSDNSGNTTTTDILVEVVDVLSPVFSNLTEIEAVYPNVYTVENIIGMLSASDNYDGDISNNIVMVNDSYSLNASVVGDYTMSFSVTDSSGNEATHDLLVHVVDQEAPIITGESTIHIGYNLYYSEDDLLSMLSVTDNYDSHLEIIIENNGYKNNHNIIGEYNIIFSSTDSSGNTSEKTLTMHVVDEIGPVVYLDQSIIQVYSNTVLQLPDFAHLLTKTNELNPEKDYLITVRYDSYTSHSDKPGTYHMRLSFKDNSGDVLDKDFEIKVIEKGIDSIYFGKEEIEINFFAKYQNILIYSGIGSVFIGTQIAWFLITRKKKI